MRGVGPRTFISYSFGDKDIANAVRNHLADAGFRTRMEDETSLLNERLPDALARRIEDAECFIQILTESANRSHWVNEELELAEEKRSRDEGFTIIPIVLHKESLGGRAQQWVYVDATAGLTRDVLELVSEAGVRSIRRVRVDQGRPVTLLSPDIDGLLQGEDSRRVILDADGYWFDCLDKLLTWACVDPDKPGRVFIAQEEDRRRRLPWTLVRADAAARILARELRASLERGFVERETAKLAFEAYYRLVFQQYFWLIAQFASQAGLLALTDDFNGLPRFGRDDTLEADAAFAWALRPALDERARLVSWGSHEVIKTGMQARGDKHSAYIYFPRSALANDWMDFRDPQALILQRDWVMFGMPQVASRAVILTQRHNPETADEAFDDIDKRMGWALSDYQDIGPP